MFDGRGEAGQFDVAAVRARAVRQVEQLFQFEAADVADFSAVEDALRDGAGLTAFAEVVLQDAGQPGEIGFIEVAGDVEDFGPADALLREIEWTHAGQFSSGCARAGGRRKRLQF